MHTLSVGKKQQQQKTFQFRAKSETIACHLIMHSFSLLLFAPEREAHRHCEFISIPKRHNPIKRSNTKEICCNQFAIKISRILNTNYFKIFFRKEETTVPFHPCQVVVHNVGQWGCQLFLDVPHLTAIHIGNHHCISVIGILRLSHQRHHLSFIDLQHMSHNIPVIKRD